MKDMWGFRLDNRKFADKKDAFIIAAVLGFSLLAFFVLNYYFTADKNEPLYAVATLKNEEILCFDLNEYENYTYISLQETYGVDVNFILENHQIRFADVTCPDHTCENYGFIGRAGEVAVCLPNKTALGIYYKSELPAKFLE